MEQPPFRGWHDTCILADVTRAATYHPHTPFPRGEAFVPHAFTPGYRSVSPTGNHNSVQLRPSAMETDLRTGIVESRKYCAMEHAGGDADMARQTERADFMSA